MNLKLTHSASLETSDTNKNKDRMPKIAAVAAILALAACSPNKAPATAAHPEATASAAATPETIVSAAPETAEQLRTSIQETAEFLAQSAIREHDAGNSEVEKLVYPDGTDGENPTVLITIQKTEAADTAVRGTTPDHITSRMVATVHTNGKEFLTGDYVDEISFEKIAYNLSSITPGFDDAKNMVVLERLDLKRVPGSPIDWGVTSTHLNTEGTYDDLEGFTDDLEKPMSLEAFNAINNRVKQEYEQARQIQIVR